MRWFLPKCMYVFFVCISTISLHAFEPISEKAQGTFEALKGFCKGLGENHQWLQFQILKNALGDQGLCVIDRLHIAFKLVAELPDAPIKRAIVHLVYTISDLAFQGNGRTPLMFAASEGYEDSIDDLINAVKEINIQERSGMTALHFAALNGHDASVKKLLRHRANPNIFNYYSRTPLMLASQGGHCEVAVALFIWGANPFLKNCYGKTALDYSRNDEMTHILSMRMRLI